MGYRPGAVRGTYRKKEKPQTTRLQMTKNGLVGILNNVFSSIILFQIKKLQIKNRI